MVGALGFSMPAFAAASSGYGKVDIKYSKADQTLTIGNDAIARTFSLKDGKLKTTLIENKLGKSSLKPGSASEEFLIETMVAGSRQEPGAPLKSVKPGASQQATATVKASSHDAGEKAVPANAIDGDAGTYWASTETANKDIWFELDFGAERAFDKIVYTPRYADAQHYHCTGQIWNFELQVLEGSEWVKKQDIELGKGKDDGKQEVSLKTTVTAQKVRIKVTNSYHWQADGSKNGTYGNIAEIDFLGENGQSVLRPAGVAGEGWKPSVSSSSNQGGDAGGAAALTDGDPNSYWHSNYGTGDGPANELPVTATIDRGSAKAPFQTFGYLPRPTSGNGNWEKFELYAADTEADLFKDENKLTSEFGKKAFTVSYEGVYGSNGANWIYFGLDKACDKRFVGVKVLAGQGGPFAAASELDLFQERFSSNLVSDASAIKASDLKVEGEPVIDASKGLVTFNFEPVAFGAGKVDIAMKVAMENDAHYMRKWIEVRPIGDNADNSTRFKFIDGEHLDVSAADASKTWTVPTNNGGVVQMPAQRANLGQPFYVNGMFFGSEFPATDTQIVNEDAVGKVARSRYWSGKSFSDLTRDKQLTTDGKFVSWQTVCGASHSDGSDIKVIQSDFFDYIDQIAKPSDFRIQYNSWFDNMMRINDENIIESFKAVDKNLNETGVRPLESYVVDDGWNNYRHKANQHNDGIGVERNGTAGKVNTEGFWAFNDKFPQGLTPSSSLVKKLGSNFGVWIGPRGGYNYMDTLADLIAEAGTGSKAGGSIDVADQRYVDNFSDMAVQWMKDYGVNYWKWDGFADNAQYDAFSKGENIAGYSDSHKHMYGGPNGFFHTTDLWEKWIVLFDRVWETASDEQIQDLWVSLTCYVNPSPWFLQWSNSVWIQCVGDRGEVHGGAGNDMMNTMLSYRDACYYEFINTNQYQFPLANVYNHDPIYGKEGTGITKNSMNGEQFRNYLFMQGTRGTAFWELYYSDELFDDEKYLINADFLKWEESNFEMLRNAKWIGGDPASNAGLTSGHIVNNPGTQEAYGFAGFNAAGNEGIISMRNPANAERTIEFVLGDAIGCTESGDYKVVRDHVYTQGGKQAADAPQVIKKGETVRVALQPGETQIWHLSKDGDAVAPTFERLYAENNTTLRVQASEHVYGAKLEVLVNGEKVDVPAKNIKAYADLKTFDITLPAAPANGVKIEVKAVDGADAAGNKIKGSIARTFHTDGIIAKVTSVACPNLSDASDSVEGLNGFTATATVKSAAADTVLVSQGDQWKLGINADGKAYFTVNGVTAVSDAKVADNATITGARENNGMLKLYVNGEISGNGYDVDKTAGYSIKPAKIVANTKAGLVSVAVYDYALGYDEVPASPLEDLIQKVESIKDKVTADSWSAAGMDQLLATAKEVLKNGDAAAKQTAYEALLAGYNKLVPGLAAPSVENLAKGIAPTASWLPGSTADPNLVVNTEGASLSKATDGAVDNTNNYGIFGKDAIKEPAYMQIDLGETAVVNEVNMWRYWQDGRTYGDTALVVAKNADFSDAKVLYYSHRAGSTDDVFKLGVDANDKPYAETSAGHKLYGDEGDAPVEARYIRLYGNGYQAANGTDNTGKENHIVELQVKGTRKQSLGDPFGIEALDALIARGETVVANADKYTAESIADVNAALDAAKPVADKVRAEIAAGSFTVTHGEFNAACDALRNALNCVQPKPEQPKPLEFSVTFDDCWPDTQNIVVFVPKDGKVARPADPTREGWKFEGWFTDTELKNAYDFETPVTGDLVLYAKWAKVSVPGGGSDEPVKPADPQKPGSNDGLAQTGDLSMVAAIGASLAGVAAIGIGGASKRRR